jgi:hypothetical protein
MSEQAKCSSCGAAILWLITENGKRMCVDAEPSTLGTIINNSDGTCRTVKKDEQGMFDGTRHVTHWATCPNAKQHRVAK